MLDLAGLCGANIGIDDIGRSHKLVELRLGNSKVRSNPQKIGKFRSHSAPLQLLEARAYLDEKERNIYANEELPKANKNSIPCL